MIFESGGAAKNDNLQTLQLHFWHHHEARTRRLMQPSIQFERGTEMSRPYSDIIENRLFLAAAPT